MQSRRFTLKHTSTHTHTHAPPYMHTEYMYTPHTHVHVHVVETPCTLHVCTDHMYTSEHSTYACISHYMSEHKHSTCSPHALQAELNALFCSPVQHEICCSPETDMLVAAAIVSPSPFGALSWSPITTETLTSYSPGERGPEVYSVSLVRSTSTVPPLSMLLEGGREGGREGGSYSYITCYICSKHVPCV